MGFDLLKAQKAYEEKCLRDAIDIGGRPAISKFLRKFSEGLSSDVINKLADYLDPNNPKVYKSGPKPDQKRTRQIICGWGWFSCVYTNSR
jgi:hypothetical protein